MSTGHDRFPAIFLPGILMPAHLRYAPLIAELGESVRPLTRELEVYRGPTPPDDYSIDLEVEGIDRAADEAGFDRFHLYGHSGGGACALAYVAAHSERVLTLAIDEPASDFSQESKHEFRQELGALQGLPREQQMEGFLRWQLAPGVDPPPRPDGPAPEWMATRPAGIEAFTNAVQRHELPDGALRAFDRPVYYSYGELSNPSWKLMRDRLAEVFPDFTAELFEGIHHLNTSHQHDPGRVARRLLHLWRDSQPAL